MLFHFTGFFLALSFTALLAALILIGARNDIYSQSSKRHTVLWYNPAKYIQNRPSAFEKTFEGCGVEPKCRLTFDRAEASRAKTVIFDGRQIAYVYKKYKRPADQIWVWWGNEAPSKYYETGTGWSELPFVS